MQGTVVYKNEKGFAFLRPDNGDSDIFLHNLALARSGIDQVEIGTRLEFQIRASIKRPGRFEAIGPIALIA